MTNARLGQPVGRVSALERAHEPAVAPGFGAGDQRMCQLLEILDLKREAAQRVAGQ